VQAKVYHYTGSETNPLSLWRSLNLLSDAWWFGWSETEMHLPQRLEGDLPHADWERLSIFNGEAELRMLSRGSETLTMLLTESIEPSGEWSLCGQYPECVATQHILLGDPPVSGGKTSRLLDVAYPAVFDYGIELAPSGEKRNRVVAHTQYYYDEAHRLRYVRYAGIDSKTW
jgi:hypothetical protein